MLGNTEPKNRHYVPKWLLEKFRAPYLYELNIFRGTTERRATDGVGSGVDIWPQDIEDELSKLDNQAARIYRAQIAGKTQIMMTKEERYDFSFWLASLIIRVPNCVKDIEAMLGDAKRDSSFLRDVILEEPERYLARLKQVMPGLCEFVINEVGELEGDKLLVQGLIRSAENGEIDILPSRDYAFNNYLRSSGIDDFADAIASYNWVWLKSNHTFVISDNPLVRWHVPTGNFNCGLRYPGTEMTIPLGIDLCLKIEQRSSTNDGRVMPCDERQTRVYNCRQRFVAVRNVYGNSDYALDFVAREVMVI
jgi:hypothetical protein